MHTDLVILDKSGDLPISQAGGTLQFHLLSKFYEKTNITLIINLSFSEWYTIFGNPKIITALPDRLTNHCHIVESGNDSSALKNELKSREKLA